MSAICSATSLPSISFSLSLSALSVCRIDFATVSLDFRNSSRALSAWKVIRNKGCQLNKRQRPGVMAAQVSLRRQQEMELRKQLAGQSVIARRYPGPGQTFERDQALQERNRLRTYQIVTWQPQDRRCTRALVSPGAYLDLLTCPGTAHDPTGNESAPRPCSHVCVWPSKGFIFSPLSEQQLQKEAAEALMVLQKALRSGSLLPTASSALPPSHSHLGQLRAQGA
ncbi:hypothetical protein JD844_006151 [Phrynosoma platyrhinos]|uniref:Uncharacterized protein n=1 Tax=Phrynosoma platyrhinos TaxID=52577 RepID=A0ABQ7TPF4_PHRPL|nr:hypothetical protein JD844_006151 [Phrynosoma platyrhinos]